ncbi:MAG: hypothetical protein M0014_11315 [Actinomycetota bacterium]|jgi:hypothetical protein|nr:hypothetical protein [Actinomycetota bacterium]
MGLAGGLAAVTQPGEERSGGETRFSVTRCATSVMLIVPDTLSAIA